MSLACLDRLQSHVEAPFAIVRSVPGVGIGVSRRGEIGFNHTERSPHRNRPRTSHLILGATTHNATASIGPTGGSCAQVLDIRPAGA